MNNATGITEAERALIGAVVPGRRHHAALRAGSAKLGANTTQGAPA